MGRVEESTVSGLNNPMYQPPAAGQPMGYPEPRGQPVVVNQQNNPVFVHNPPMPMQVAVTPVQFTLGNTQKWQSDLFDCMNDPSNALITLFVPCVTFGQIAEIVDSGSTTCGTSGAIYGTICFCLLIPCIYSCTFRTKLRSKFGLPESPAPDWITHCLCECCALCQEYRELQLRGYDPAIGWQGNIQRNPALANQHVMMAAPMQQRMMG